MVIAYPRAVDNNCAKYYPDQTKTERSYGPTQILGMCALDFDLGDKTFGQGHDTPGQGLLAAGFKLLTFPASVYLIPVTPQ